MALELMEMLVQFLCPTSSAASQCQSFISSHSGVMPPFGQYIYFLFFPTVFLLLFLWIVFKDAVHANKGISLIATIAVFVFVIIQGFYPIFLFLGEAWIIVIFLLGFLYVLTRRFRGEGGGGGKGKMPGLGGGITGALTDRARHKLEKKMAKRLGLLRDEERIIDEIETKIKNNKYDFSKLTHEEQMIIAARYGVSLEALKTREALKSYVERQAA